MKDAVIIGTPNEEPLSIGECDSFLHDEIDNLFGAKAEKCPLCESIGLSQNLKICKNCQTKFDKI